MRESFLRVMETVVQTHGDGWMRQSDEHGGVRTAWDEGGSHSSLASHSCLCLGKPCSPWGWGHPVPIQKKGEPPASAQRQTWGATIERRSSTGKLLEQRK